MDVLREVLAVGLVLGLMGLALWALRRRGLAAWGTRRPKGAARRLTVVERVALSPQHTLHLVRVAGHALIVAAHPGGCTLVETVDWRELDRPKEVVG